MAMTTLAKTMRNAVMAGAMLATLTLLSGCDLATLAGLSNLAGSLGGWDTGYYYPSTTLYDPTADIQSVIDYRQEVYDNSNAAWDEYIRE
jgi:hypothetical protein